MILEKRRQDELQGIILKIYDNPNVVDQVNDSIDKMFTDLGFKLSPEEKKFIITDLISEKRGKSSPEHLLCAGTGARCCRY